MSIPLEDAPFGIYLDILRENGHEDDAEISKTLYVNLLSQVATEEELMKISFKKIVEASEKVLQEAQKEALMTQPVLRYSGQMLGGVDVTPQVLMQLAQRQTQIIEEEKQRLRMN